MTLSDTAKRRLWTCFLICVGILALTAIAPFALPQRIGSFYENVLGTVALVAGVALLVLAEIVNWRPSMRIVCVLGFIAALATLLSTLSLIWYWAVFINPFSGRSSHLDLYRIVMFLWILAVAFPMDGLLSLARLPGALVWVRHATSLCLWSLAAVLIYITFERPYWSISEYTLMRIVAAITIAGLFGIVAVIVLHKRNAIRMPVLAPLAEQRVTLSCPGCGRTQRVAIGQSTCPSCRLVFRIEVEAPTCAKCGYMLFQLTSDACPECGSPIQSVVVKAV